MSRLPDVPATRVMRRRRRRALGYDPGEIKGVIKDDEATPSSTALGADDLLTSALAAVSFVDRPALRLVCKRWLSVIESEAFAAARADVGETGTVLICGDSSRLIVGGRLLRGPRMPVRSAIGTQCVVHGGTVVVVGGHAGGYWAEDAPPCHTHVLDVSRGTWSTLPAPPDAGHGAVPVLESALGVLEGRLFIAGGGNADPDRTAEEEFPDEEPPMLPGGVYEYDFSAGSWRERAPMPFPVRNGAWACDEKRGVLYVIGGTDFDGEAPPYGRGFQRMFLQMYFARDDEWEVVHLPRCRSCAHAYNIDDQIYYSGGIGNGILQRWVEVIDLGTLERDWSSLFGRMPPNRVAVTTIKPPGWEDAPDTYASWQESDRENNNPGPVVFQCPSGCIDGQYVVLDHDNVLRMLNEDGSWTPYLRIPGHFEYPPMASRVPLV